MHLPRDGSRIGDTRKWEYTQHASASTWYCLFTFCPGLAEHLAYKSQYTLTPMWSSCVNISRYADPPLLKCRCPWHGSEDQRFKILIGEEYLMRVPPSHAPRPSCFCCLGTALASAPGQSFSSMSHTLRICLIPLPESHPNLSSLGMCWGCIYLVKEHSNILFCFNDVSISLLLLFPKLTRAPFKKEGGL